MTTTSLDTIIQAVRESLDRRDSRRDLLAEKIEKLATEALDASRVAAIDLGDGVRIERRAIDATCSQWADGSSPRRNRERHTVLVTREGTFWLTEHDLSHFDGSNMLHQRGAAHDGGTRVKRATVRQLRSVAAALPNAIATTLEHAQQKAETETAQAGEAIAAIEPV